MCRSSNLSIPPFWKTVNIHSSMTCSDFSCSSFSILAPSFMYLGVIKCINTAFRVSGAGGRKIPRRVYPYRARNDEAGRVLPARDAPRSAEPLSLLLDVLLQHLSPHHAA